MASSEVPKTIKKDSDPDSETRLSPDGESRGTAIVAGVEIRMNRLPHKRADC